MNTQPAPLPIPPFKPDPRFTYLCFANDTTEADARHVFEIRYKRQPEIIGVYKQLVWAGPIPKG